MDPFLAIFLFLIPIFVLLVRRGRGSSASSKKIPPGFLGFPIIGQSLGLLWAMKANTAEKWIQDRATKYGPVSKLCLFGKPTVFIYGQAANKFVFTSDSRMLSSKQPTSIRMMMGDRNIWELSGEDHKRVRESIASFLKPESLKQYVGKMDGEIRRHLQMHWDGKDKVKVLPLMKTLTFNIICSLILGVEDGPRIDELVKLFDIFMAGMWCVPVNFPFTQYNRSLQATAQIRNIVKQLIQEKKVQLKKGGSSHQDLITYLLSIPGKDNQLALSEEEIVHNIVFVMVAGRDTISVVLTFMIRLLANDQHILSGLLQEHEEIAKTKLVGELLTWEDLGKMKYTWKVAMEALRMFPPVYGNFKTAVKDIEYDGYLIPQGWQVFWVTGMTHMDEGIFQEPSKFDPERFDNQASLPPYSFIAFGGGYRICPGNEFAKIETLVTIHYLVTRFTWKLCCKEDTFSRDPMPVPNQGLPIQIAPRAQATSCQD